MMLRQDVIGQIRAKEQWDMVIIGGGATGLGAAVDAASRGYSTLLLEAVDFAKGTSSRSTKLVHGGVRYLAQGNISLVREALKERGLLRRNAPHLVSDLPFVVPGYNWWDRPYYGVGLTLYSLLAGKLGIKFSTIISRDKALKLVPTLESKGLKGGVVYYDGQFDDTRLAVTMLLTMQDKGGVALNYAPVTGLIKEGGHVAGVYARDAETGETLDIKAKVVVNATGVFADSVRKMDDTQVKSILAPSQGIHVVLDRSFLPGDHAIMIPKTDDGRVLFAIPWHNRVVVGTTDTPVKDIEFEPRPMKQEIEFVLSHAARYLSKDPRPEDVLSVFAGLRPLVKAGDDEKTSALSRDHTLIISPNKLVTITGGKWTTYRHMAEDAVNRAAETGGLPQRPCVTENLKLHGWQDRPEPAPFDVYGADAADLKGLFAENAEWGKPMHPDLPYRWGEVIWAVRKEMARTVEDVLSRRTRALLLNASASREVAPKVAEMMAAELGFDVAWQEEQVQQFDEVARNYGLQPGTISRTPAMEQVTA